MILQILAVFGSFIPLLISYNIYRFVTFYFHTPAHPLQSYKRTSGTSWAVISGSSAGIGYALAHHLLSLGFGVVIFAHEGVPEAEAKLRKVYPNGHIKAFTFNCMTASVSDIQNFLALLKDLPITILINNVGSIPQAAPAMRPFADFEHDAIDNTISLNATFMTHLTHLAIPMLRVSAQPRSLILNVSSAGLVGMPWISIYSATKAYIAPFSRALNREFHTFNEPIDCLCIIPGDVKSNGNKFVPEGTMLASEFAREVVGRVDRAIERDLLECIPYWKHMLQFKVLELLPESIARPELAKVIEFKVKAWEKDE